MYDCTVTVTLQNEGIQSSRTMNTLRDRCDSSVSKDRLHLVGIRAVGKKQLRIMPVDINPACLLWRDG